MSCCRAPAYAAARRGGLGKTRGLLQPVRRRHRTAPPGEMCSTAPAEPRAGVCNAAGNHPILDRNVPRRRYWIYRAGLRNRLVPPVRLRFRWCRGVLCQAAGLLSVRDCLWLVRCPRLMPPKISQRSPAHAERWFQRRHAGNDRRFSSWPRIGPLGRPPSLRSKLCVHVHRGGAAGFCIPSPLARGYRSGAKIRQTHQLSLHEQYRRFNPGKLSHRLCGARSLVHARCFTASTWPGLPSRFRACGPFRPEGAEGHFRCRRRCLRGSRFGFGSSLLRHIRTAAIQIGLQQHHEVL